MEYKYKIIRVDQRHVDVLIESEDHDPHVISVNIYDDDDKRLSVEEIEVVIDLQVQDLFVPIEHDDLLALVEK